VSPERGLCPRPGKISNYPFELECFAAFSVVSAVHLNNKRSRVISSNYSKSTDG